MPLPPNELPAILERVRLARRLLEIQLQELDRAKGERAAAAASSAAVARAAAPAPAPADRLSPLAPRPAASGPRWQTAQTTVSVTSTWTLLVKANSGRRTLVFANLDANVVLLSLFPLAAMATGGLRVANANQPVLINLDQWGTLVQREWWGQTSGISAALTILEEWQP